MRLSFVALSSLLALTTVAAGCNPGRSGPSRRGDGGPFIGSDATIGRCEDITDSDGDGIADSREGTADPDGDGAGNSMDTDSDGDGISDADENDSTNPCNPTDSDGDGSPDAYDTDSDNDGVPDSSEVTAGTDPRNIDTDGDGITDLGEAAAGTDPRDPTSTIPADDFFVVLPYNGDHEMRPLRFGTNITQADVFFLVDMTGSMGGERTNLINGLVGTIIPGIAAAIDDVEFGAGGLDDYPTGGYGAGNDRPFYLLRDIGPAEEDRGSWSISAGPTTCPRGDTANHDVGGIAGGANGRPDILEAVEGLPCHGGSDGPESYVPALYATATGEGLDWPGGSVPPRGACPSFPDEEGTRRGYPCFRPGSLPIVILFGDWTFHNGPAGEDTYSFVAPTFAQATTALNGIGARVMSVFSGGEYGNSPAHYEELARQTGAVRGTGAPLVFAIAGDGSGLSSAVVDAVSELVGGTPQDVTTQREDVPADPPSDPTFDATAFIKSITPVEGYGAGGRGTGYSSKDATTFYDVIPGTDVEFAVDFWNDVYPPAATAIVFQARIIVIGNGVARLDERRVFIVVPPEGGEIILM
jgi:hypothetical protein